MFSLIEGVTVMKRTVPLSAWLAIGLFAAFTFGMLCRHGREWEFSRHGIPVSVLSPDGQTYRNGNEIDPFMLSIIRSGNEEAIMAGILGVMLASLGLLAYQIWAFKRAGKRFRLIWELLDASAQLRREGKFEDAARVLDRGQGLLDTEIERLKRRGLWKCPPASPIGTTATK
jgi:hypothetical protein